MKLIGLIVFLLAAVAAQAQTNQDWKVCRNPVRIFSGHATVDLTPLYQWWERQPLVVTNRSEETNSSDESDRPLSAWYLVTGTKVGDLGSSWVVDAVIYTSPTIRSNARIILNHPPEVEEQRYYTLKAQLAQAEQQVINAQDVYGANTNAEMQALERANFFRYSRSKLAADGVRDYTALAARYHTAAVAALDQLKLLEAARTQIEEQLKTVPSVNGVYQVDWFAVLLGRSKQGVPIYDMGLVSAMPP